MQSEPTSEILLGMTRGSKLQKETGENRGEVAQSSPRRELRCFLSGELADPKTCAAVCSFFKRPHCRGACQAEEVLGRVDKMK